MGRYSMHLTGRSAAELQTVAHAAEEAGVESLWASELYTNPFVPLAAVAGATSRMQLGTGIALAFVRSPLALALTALDLDALTGGRFVLGLGTGVRRLNEQWHGVTRFGPPVAHMREVVAFIRDFERRAHTGEPLHHDGDHVRVEMKGYRRPWPPTRPRVPIYFGANRPGMLRLAGEIADGVIGHVFVSPSAIRTHWLPPIREGLARSGRPREALTVSCGITVAIDPDRATARRHAAGPLAFYATVKTYQPLFAADGFEDDVERIRAAYHAGEKTRAVDLVSDAMIDTYCAAGPIDDVRASLRRWDGLVDVKGVTPPRHFCPPDAHDVYRTRLLDLIASGG